MTRFFGFVFIRVLVVVCLLNGLALSGAADTSECALMIWKVTPPGGKIQPSYFLGTLHCLEPKLYSEKEDAFQLLASSVVFVMEADTSKANPSDLAQYTQYQSGKDLKSDLTEPLYQKTIKYMKEKLNFQEEPVNAMKPLWVQSLIQIAIEPPLERIMDDVFKERALKSGLKTAFLESWLTTCKLSSIVPMDEQVRALKEVIEQPEGVLEVSRELRAAYLAGDIEKLTQVVFNPEVLKNFPVTQKALYPDRHEKWLPELEKNLNSGNAFIAVGVGHILGETGLLEALKKKGYSLERIFIK